MPSANPNGVYTRTKAYKLLKELLGVSEKVLINEHFFFIFFKDVTIEFGNRSYLIKKPKEQVQNMFIEQGIPTLNKTYFENKKAEKWDEAKEISHTILHTCRQAIAA